MKDWQVALTVVVSLVAFFFIAWQVALQWVMLVYGRMIKDNVINVDDFVGGPPSPKSALKCLFYNWFNLHGRKPSSVVLDLHVEDLDKVPGLKVTN